MANQFKGSVRGLAVRFTRLDDCWNTTEDTEASSRVTTDCFVEVTYSPVYRDATEIEVVGASGKILINDRDESRIKGMNITVRMSGVPLPVIEMALGASLLMDDSDPDLIRGFVLPNREQVGDPLQFEFWSRKPKADMCAGDDNKFWHWIAPACTDWRLAGDLVGNVDNQAEFQFSCYAEGNINWSPSITDELPVAAWETTIAAGGPLAVFDTDSLPQIEVGATYDTAASS